MTGKAPIVNSSFGGSKITGLTGSREVGEQKDGNSFATHNQSNLFQSMNPAGHPQTQQRFYNQASNVVSPGQRQFSAVHFRKNETSGSGFGGAEAFNAKSGSDHSGIGISIGRGGSQAAFPTQLINFGANQQSLLSGQSRQTGVLGNNLKMNEDSNAALVYQNQPAAY